MNVAAVPHDVTDVLLVSDGVHRVGFDIIARTCGVRTRTEIVDGLLFEVEANGLCDDATALVLGLRTLAPVSWPVVF